MDNLTYDAVNLTPISNDDGETYSKLSRTRQFQTSNLQTPRDYQSQSIGEDNDVTLREVKLELNAYRAKVASLKKTMVVAIVLLIVILLLISLVSIALSIVTFSRSSLSSNELNQVKYTTQDTLSVLTQLATTQSNITHALNLFDDRIIQLATTQNNITRVIGDRISHFISSVQTQNENLQTQLYCGPGQWYRVAYLNMSNHREQCPSVWRQYNVSGVRACGRHNNGSGSCPAAFYSTNSWYSRVCGRVIGYQFASPDAFGNHGDRSNVNILDGIIITHGVAPQYTYIWSYVASVREDGWSACPCNGPQAIIGDNYYCESGNPANSGHQSHLYVNDKLWDGLQCEGNCCTGSKTPPWFSVRLPAPTNDSIEVRICCDESTDNEDTPIELLELYVQ